MKKSSLLKFAVLTLFTYTLLISRSEDAELTIEEKLVGSWQAEVLQADLGTLELNRDFQELVANNKSGNWTTESKDLSICDATVFDCSEFSCLGTFDYTRTENRTIFFDLGLINGDCWDEGIARVSFIDDNTINYTFTPPPPYESDGISGVFERQ